jgi:hypothetical protein
MQTSAIDHLSRLVLPTATITAIGKQPIQRSEPEHNRRAGLLQHVGRKRPA